jgi:hypothetical protein
MKRSDVLHTITNLKGEEGHQKVLEVYNAQNPLPRGYKLQPKDAWCASTVSAVLLMNGYSAISECSCTVMTKKAQDLGIWVEDDGYTPKVGDVIMYDWQDDGKGDNMGNPDHVGFVVKVTDKKITVREGNKANSVGNRTLDINGKYIRGYIVPPYEDDTTQETSQEVKEELQDLQWASSPSTTVEAKESQEKAQGTYVVGRVYTVSVQTALNVRRGPGKNYGLVGYANLTADGKKHAYTSGALKNGTRVTCQQVVNHSEDNIWIKIPSGWICAVDGDNVLVK